MTTVKSSCKACALAIKASILTLCALLGACSTIGPEQSIRPLDRVTIYGVNPQFENDKFEIVDLIVALDPAMHRKTTYPKASHRYTHRNLSNQALSDTEDSHTDAQDRTELELAFNAFYDTRYDAIAAVDTRIARLQDRLLASSDQRCEVYKIYLRRFEAYYDTGFGLATTIIGGAAAIAGGLKDARILGGLAGMASGARAEVRQGMFGNLASYIIVPGIEKRRKTLFAEIRERRAQSDYTVQAAVRDSARYHGACTLETGMEEAKDAIQTVDNPGLVMVGRTLNSVLQTQHMARVINKGAAATADDFKVPSFSGIAAASAGLTSGSAIAAALSPPKPNLSSIGVVQAKLGGLLSRLADAGQLAADLSAMHLARAEQEPYKDAVKLSENEKIGAELKATASALKTASTNVKTLSDALSTQAVLASQQASKIHGCLLSLQSAELLQSSAVNKDKLAEAGIKISNELSKWSQLTDARVSVKLNKVSALIANHGVEQTLERVKTALKKDVAADLSKGRIAPADVPVAVDPALPSLPNETDFCEAKKT